MVKDLDIRFCYRKLLYRDAQIFKYSGIMFMRHPNGIYDMVSLLYRDFLSKYFNEKK